MSYKTYMSYKRVMSYKLYLDQFKLFEYTRLRLTNSVPICRALSVSCDIVKSDSESRGQCTAICLNLENLTDKYGA
jgi:hypothetical protein